MRDFHKLSEDERYALYFQEFPERRPSWKRHIGTAFWTLCKMALPLAILWHLIRLGP